MLLEELVSKNLNKLNPTDLIIWRYIYANKAECPYMSIYNIAINCNVSKTTVLRFAKKLGLDGFSDLKTMLKMELNQKIENSSIDIAQATINLCEQVGKGIAKQDFTKLNKLLYNAKRIFVYASGYVQKNVASEISRLFVNCNILVYEIKVPDEFATIIRNIRKGDLFIIISLSGESKNVIDVAQKLYLQKIPIISLTQLESNALATLSTGNIYITPVRLPATVDFEYKSMLGFFLAVEIWFVSYSQYCIDKNI